MNHITESVIKWLENANEGYKKEGKIPTIDLLLEDLKKPSEKSFEEAFGLNKKDE